jgi:bifunctional oligoribonuclease and PAP phosphatase NrnA
MPNILKKNWIKSKGNRQQELLAPHAKIVHQIANILRSSKAVAIAAHEHPDGDALGSSLALRNVLQQQGKQVAAHIPDAAPEFFSFLPGIEYLSTAQPNLARFDTVVVLDSTQLYRTRLEEQVRSHPQTIIIDHHFDNSKEGKVNLVVPQAAATAHVLFEFFQMTGWPIDKDTATCLLTGIFTDTGSFMHDSVTPDILEISSVLMSKGARLAHIAHETYQKKDLPALRIWGRALSRILTSQATNASVSILTYQDLKECGATLDDLAGVVNMLNALPQTKLALLLVEYEPGKIKGSLRSEPHKGVDVSQFAKRLGGGGHKLASGFEVTGHLVEKAGMWRIEPASDVARHS